MMQRLKRWLQRMDVKLGTWLCRKFPRFAQAADKIGFEAGQGFSADLQIKVIRKNEKEKSDPQNTKFRTFWNRIRKTR